MVTCGTCSQEVRGQKFTNVDEIIFMTFSFCCQLVKDIQHVSGFLYHDSRNYQKVKFKILLLNANAMKFEWRK